ncbi:MAG TPA: ribosome maturation factor RimP [Thermodesulfobacteriota bacterium]|nr:ribosome maturation factor RimP [Thermodesulfobacteriota bacterium]
MKPSDKLLEDIRQVVEPIAASGGFELVDLEYRRESHGWVLRIYLDREGGITLEDCAGISGEIGTVLEVKDLIPNPYALEVSSPGLTRPLKKPEDYEKFKDQLVKIRLYQPLEGRKNFKGTLLGIEGETVRVNVDGCIYDLPFRGIAKANLEFEL